MCLTASPEYHVWYNTRRRCHNPKDEKYVLYGEGGIEMCERWRNDFREFYKDMGPRPTKKHCIGRLDTSKGYNPENCLWLTKKEQANLKSNNVRLEYNGELLTIAELAGKYDVPVDQIYRRSRYKGWTVHDMLFKPLEYRGERLC